MTRLHATLIALALCAAPQTASAAPSEFDRIVHTVEAQTGARRLHLVGMGFFFRASALVARAARASDEQHGFSGAAFEGALTHALDTSWHLTVRMSSNGDTSQTVAWVRVRPDEKQTDLMVMTVGWVNNGVLTAFRLSTKRFQEWVAKEEARTPTDH